MRNALVLLMMMCGLVCTDSHASEASVFTADYSKGMLDRDDVMGRSVNANKTAFPDAEEVLLGALRRAAYRADGTYVQWHEEYIKILTEQARRSHRTISSHYTIPYQRGPEDCRIALVEIIKPDGSVVTIDVEKQSKEMIDPSSMSANIYNPNDKIIKCNIPGLEIGDVLHYIMFDRIVQPRMANSWSDWLTFESTRPILSSIAEVYAPSDMPLKSIALKSAVDDSVDYDSEEWGGGLKHRWEGSNVSRMFPEPSMPPVYSVVQRVLMSTNPDWQTVSKWYWDLSEPHFAMTDDIKTKVDELTQDATTPLEKINALFSFVSQEIRYMGITAETTAPGYEPHDVADTFSARHGVCRDKAALLVAMIRESGVEAFPTLIHNGVKKDEEVPQPYFNHAIVAARVDGEYVLMDPTDEATKELLPSYLDDRSFLVATPEGEKLMTSPIEPSDVNLLDIQTTGTLDRDGNLEAETLFSFNGINDNAYRGYFSRIKPEERRRLFETVVKRASPRARVTEIMILPENMQDTSTSLSARVAYVADDTFVTGSGLSMAPLPIMGARVGMVNFIVGKTGLKERKFPLQTGYACGVRERISLALSDGLEAPVLIPSSDPVDSQAIRWSQVMAYSNGHFTVDGNFRLEVAEFTPDQYLALKDTLRTIERAMRKMPAFPNTQADESSELAAGSDVVIEDADITYHIQGPGTWSQVRKVKKRVLTYAGIKKNSELKIGFNPAWETLTLDRAQVTAPDGKVSTISDKEINIMDVGWVGSAPRYPAAKTFVASLPAVEVGSVIEYQLTRTVTNRAFFAARESFAGFDAVARKSVTILAPPALLPETKVVHGSALTPSHGEAEDGRHMRRWVSEAIPGALEEDSTPPGWEMFPTLLASGGTLAEYATWVQARLAVVTAGQSNAVTTAQALVVDAADRDEKIRLIRNYVATTIRKTGPRIADVPLTAISLADTTLADAYGHGTDHAVLLYVMLNAVDVDAEFVLASSLPNIERFKELHTEVPHPGVFSSLLVRVKDAGVSSERGDLYLGDSNQYDAPGATHYDHLLALDLGTGDLSPVASAFGDLSETTYRIYIEQDGATRLTKDTLLYGSAFGAANKSYSEMTPELRRRHFQELVAGVSQSAEAVGDLRTDFERYPGQIRYTVEVPDWAIRDGDYLYFSIPSMVSGTFNLRSDEREHPLYMARHRRAINEISIECPAGFKPVIVPENVTITDFAGTELLYEVNAHEAKGGGLDILVRADLTQTPVVLPASEYDKLLQLHSSLSHRKSRTVVLTRDVPSEVGMLP